MDRNNFVVSRFIWKEIDTTGFQTILCGNAHTSQTPGRPLGGPV